MKNTIRLICVLAVLAGPVSARSNDRTLENAIRAYVYAYPMVLMEITRRSMTNVDAAGQMKGPMNEFVHVRAFPDPSMRDVVRPNADTLYSTAWVDVSDGPVVLSIADTGGRYFMLPILDMWTDVVASPGGRTTGTQDQTFALVGPDWRGRLPKGVERIRLPTNVAWIIGRTKCNGPSDYETVHRIQDGYDLIPLKDWGKKRSRKDVPSVNPAWDMKTPPPVQVAEMSAREFFELFAKLLQNHPPHESDWNILAQLKRIGISPGGAFEFSQLSPAQRKALEDAVPVAKKLIAGKTIGSLENGWLVSREMMGSYGTAYLQRAYIALIGLGANLPLDAIYPMAAVDAGGVPFDGSRAYVIHFDAGDIPPVKGFWSVTVYDDDLYLVDNPIDRYAIGDRDALEFNEDGSLDLYIQHQSPGKDRESNWLPAPKGRFDLILRLYWPRYEVLLGQWSPPAVTRIE